MELIGLAGGEKYGVLIVTGTADVTGVALMLWRQKGCRTVPLRHNRPFISAVFWSESQYEYYHSLMR